ncbi:unknown [Firmicutes bacterium CAG:449]|nr:unknown [Firmicutes bacterium CAG:449]
MKKSVYFLLSLLLIGCSQTSTSDTSSNSSYSSISENSSNTSSNTESSSSESSSSNETSSIEQEHSVELVIENTSLKVGDEVVFQVKTVPSNLQYTLTSLNEDVLKIIDNKVIAIKEGHAFLKVSLEDKEDVKEITVKNYSSNDLKEVLNKNIENEKDQLSKTLFTSYIKSDNETTYFENEISYYQGPSVTSIKKYMDYVSKEVTSTEYSFLGTYNNKDYSMVKSVPSTSYDNFSTQLNEYDNKELFYDSETGQTGLLSALNYITFDSSYMDYDNASEITNYFEDNKLNIVLSIKKECESNFYWEDKYYLVKSMHLIIEEEKIVEVSYSSNKYFDYDLSKNEFNEDTSNKKYLSYFLTWSCRGLEKDVNVVPTSFLPSSFDIKLYKDEGLTNESYIFKVGEDVYYNVINVNPSNAFINMSIEVNSKGGNVTTYNKINCTSAGEVELVFTSINGISRKVNIVIEEVKPESVSFDSFMSSTVKVNETIYIWYTVLPYEADNSVILEIIEGEDIIAIEDNDKIRGLKVGKAVIKITCASNEKLFDTKEIIVEE